MRVGGIAAVAGAAFVVVACGLDLRGLGPSPSEGGTTGDAGLGGDVASGGLVDSTAPLPDGTVEGGPPLEAAAETSTVPDAPDETSGVDSPAPPTCPPGVLCNGTCIADTDCHACLGAPLLCGATGACGADCKGCASSPIECFACDANRQNPIGACARQDPMSYCLNTSYVGAYVDGGPGYHCGCTTAADCPGDSQVCIGVGSPNPPFACFTCGEKFTDMATCKAGTGKAMCNEMKASCD